MGGVSSKDASPEAFTLFKKCRERYEAQLKRTMKELDQIREDYTRRGKRPFDVQESQEITLILNKIGNRTFLCSLGGGIFSYAAVRHFTRYNTGFRRAFLRTSATLAGFMIGSTYGAFTALSMYSAEFLEKSRWSPRLICPAVSQYKPCIEHSGCRELMTKDGWARVLLDCYSVCERRRKELTLTGRALEEGLGEEEGAGGFEEVGFATAVDDHDFQEPDFTSEEEMAGDKGKGDSQSGGQGKKGKSGW